MTESYPDLLLYFSGMNSRGGDRLTPNDGKNDDDMLNLFSKHFGKNRLKLAGWGGSADSNKNVKQATDFIRENSPSGKLIIYGYSAGGVNAFELCRNLYHNRTMRDVVDLLVVVDAAMGEISNSLNRSVYPNVKVCLNCYTYKTTALGDSHGKPASALSLSATKMRNMEFPDADHDSIRLMSKDNVIWEITKCLRK